uniref:ribosomal protein S4 n=1 Tax=Scytothamnus australis TaxID=66621 RepID=UPI002E77BDDD|nr:ribosomal protein S4 [Scytothamnus australis]WBP70291.1 ribosomal protein S4 [Scytothamnus australis]
MRLKHKYKSCLWSRTDIWGDLLSKENNFLRRKWDAIMGILRNRRRRYRLFVKRRRYRLCQDQKFIKPRARANQTYKATRWGYRNTLSHVLCVRRYYGDIKHRSFKRFCQIKSGSRNPSGKLLGILEGRLDITLYRLGFFHSIYYSRQAILHNKVLVNGKSIGQGGLVLKKGDYVEFCPSQREAVRARLLARYKHFRSAAVRIERYNLSFRSKYQLNLQPTPNWIQTDYSNLSFMLSSDVCAPVWFPFRIDVDEIFWATKYGYF